ncbi:hypothetical protein Q31b_21940 [Novipirellula aureliae]|uniref:Uncharacterized protein n=1 Tax=Novipirellula aureliae TaxID=2527966 RepID=A0A5C6E6S1_9BACT|nr:hypothetical protein Q31b_21940 [Novipirellula aureliae]
MVALPMVALPMVALRWRPSYHVAQTVETNATNGKER